MANLILGAPNRIDGATLSGGSWAATLPLNNLKVRTIGKKARSANALAASTQFDVDLGASKNIRLFGAIAHNFSMAATYRLRGSTVANFATTVYDSGAGIPVWPVVFPSGTIDWENDNWWSGQYTAEDVYGVNWNLIVVLPANTLARYWRLEIVDTANAAGYVEIGRVFIGPAWQPTYNCSYGAALEWETPTTAQAALSGAEYFARRTPFRSQQFTLDWLTVDEALSQAYELQKRVGIDGEVLFIFDPADTVHAIRRQFLGRLRKLSPIEYPYFNTHQIAFEVKELL